MRASSCNSDSESSGLTGQPAGREIAKKLSAETASTVPYGLALRAWKGFERNQRGSAELRVFQPRFGRFGLFPAVWRGEDICIERIFAALFMTEEFLNPSHADPLATANVPPAAEISRHPSAATYDHVFAATLPDVPALARHKNVPLGPGEDVSILRHALEKTSRKTLRRVRRGDDDATFSLYLSLCHSLDVFAAARMIGAMIAVQGEKVPDAATLVLKAEAAMATPFANDKSQTIRIWPDLVAAATEYYHRVSQMAVKPPVLTLPDSVTIRCTVRPAQKPWGPVIRAATPGGENLAHD
jgi:hypothetical protein